MILDSGICTIYGTTNAAAEGDMPVDRPSVKFQSWYGEIDFEVAPDNTGKQEETEIVARVRILQFRALSAQDVIVLSPTVDPPVDAVKYHVARAYHAIDHESGEPITDLSLTDREVGS